MSVGSQLQQARSERKLSLADVTKETKIQPWVLEALEADRLQEIMSPVYVKGFLTTYAKFLHLEPEPLIAQVLPPPAPEPPQPQPLPPPSNIPVILQWHIPLHVRRRVGLAAAVSVGLVSLTAVHPLRWLSNVTLPSLRVPKLASVTRVSEPAAQPPSLHTVALASSQPLELTVNAQRTTWIQLRADGRLLTQQQLLRGANERWTAKKQFELIVARPSEVELTLNGHSIDPFAIAHHGRLLITHRGITKLPDEEE